MTTPRRLTWAARLLISGLASPAVIGAGAFIYTAHPFIGGTVLAYGILWSCAAAFVGGPVLFESGFTTKEYTSSLKTALKGNAELRDALRAEKSLREKFQAALTDGEARP